MKKSESGMRESGNQKHNCRIKLWPFTAMLLAIADAPLLGGCSVLGTDTSAPNAIEHKLFTTVTNYVEVPVQKSVTNYVAKEVTVYQTNTVGQIMTVTNVVSTPVYSVVTVTNLVPQYENTVKTGTADTVKAGGGILNTFFPGVGSMASSGVLALLALWAQMRSGKRQDTSAALVQEVETMREFIKTLPSGTKYDAAITAFLQQHQLEAGVATQVLGLLDNQVSNPDAKAAIEQIQGTLKAVAA